ncbi:spondin domain-containing protein [Flavilitoribacter nigricans]|uniref:DUF4397 domain-containing protein n=1 Tax=Flavilitoribacter nigricans (strain ATCC 23147 / DSM 23189 / NBRC 102662 / NCIMB 1420 / SS-2) TaxID=1122177 RepID=A0A2D0N084_FLAN2|nr:spondin domain-containing protein [Flavilitoribacter nigricans]PHN01559.1 hypothetical protein CRP01_36270 [Flavilitoribacter nigricans DSM 23189 = NBRC 102662]
MRQPAYLLTFLLFFGILFSLTAQPTYFKVKVENVGEAYPFSQSGVFHTPVGAAAPGPILPGGVYEFDFEAAPGSYLSFATMFVQSNDLFYAPAESGIALYDEMGNPMTGDLTDQLLLWDSGTEINQAPGEGADQAPRQSGMDVGMADPDNTVRLVNDSYDYPMTGEVIRFTLIHNGGTSFTGQIENVSTSATLALSDGSTVAVPLAPGVFVVHTAPAPLFTEGEMDRGEGLEGVAEDGNTGLLGETIHAHTGITPVLSPGAFVVHGGMDPLFSAGEMDRGEGLVAIAEDGNPEMLALVLQNATSMTGGAFAVPVGGSGPAPIGPGGAYEFVIASGPTGKLSLVSMFVQSNDLFYAPDGMGVALFTENGMPVSGDITEYFDLWDVGSEINEIPGIGLNQAPRQSGADTGADDPDNTVRLVNDGFTYPADESVIRVTLMPLETTQFTVRVENVSTPETLPTGDGSSVAVPLSPGFWALHATPAPLFSVGAPDRGQGLEEIAEDGDPAVLAETLAGKMGTPRGAFTTPAGGMDPAPAFPGEAYEFTITAAPGIYLSLATMFVQSNDLFYAPGEMGVPLFDENGDPISGDITEYFDLWDAGTEENEQPGVGPNQAPRQSGPDMGAMDMDDLVRLVNDAYSYPADEDVIRVTINPVVETGTAKIQVIHAAESQTLEVKINGAVISPAFAYRTATPYLEVPAGTPLTIELTPVGGPIPADQVETIEVELESGETYVAAAYGTFDPDDEFPFGVALFSPAVATAESGNVALSFFHGANGVGVVEVLHNGSSLFSGAAYSTFDDFVDFPAADFELSIPGLGDYEGSFGFWSGKSAVIFASGTAGSSDIQPWVALSNGGTYPLSMIDNFVDNGISVEHLNGTATATTPPTAVVFPNPAKGLTTLQYELPESTRVNIRLSDLRGNLIRTIYQGTAAEGVHQITEDISDLPGGMYLYSIVTDETVQTLRLMVR